jgi:hypothetical protein
LFAVFVASSIRRSRYYNVAPGLRAMSPGFDARNGVKSLCYLLLVASRFMVVQEGFLTGYKPFGRRAREHPARRPFRVDRLARPSNGNYNAN